MRLESLMHGLPLRRATPEGDAWNPEVLDLCVDSREVRPGALFMAREGWFIDSHQFIDRALAAGAVGIVVTRPECIPAEPTVPYWVSESEDRDLGWMADRFFDHPTHRLVVVGTTGTNGKTSCTWMLAHALTSIGHRVAIIGTVSHRFESRVIEARNTTPDGLFIHRFARECLDAGATALVMEVSSHGLVLDRVAGTAWDAVAFTNLTPDHLDFHRTFDAYREAKWLLFFEQLDRARAVGKRPRGVVLTDSEEGRRLADALDETTRVAVSTDARSKARVCATAVHPEGLGWYLTIEAQRADGAAVLRLPLPGLHNVQNALVVAGLLAVVAIERWVEAVQSLARFPGVPGRLERAADPLADEPPVYVDYAHTPDAVRRIVAVVPEPAQGAVLIVGCGGDRDATKRPLMAQAAVERGHRVVFTADNPRSEAVQDILDAMLAGLSEAERAQVTVIADRSEAIAWAVANAGRGGVWILGKGHETYQEIAGRKYHLDDREEARRALWARRHGVAFADAPIVAGWDAERWTAALGGRLVARGPNGPHGALYIDTRAPQPSGVFCALEGERQDGHAWVGAATKAGASMVVVSRESAASDALGCDVVLVDDVTQAMSNLSAAVLHEARRRPGGLWVIAVTGSNGKTTTKETTAALLRARGHETHATPGNWNNRWGIPLTVSRLTASHRRAVIEMGAGDVGDIGGYADTVKPDVAVITSIGWAHTETLGGLDGVRATKAGIARGGRCRLAVLPAVECDALSPLVAGHAAAVATFGAEQATLIAARPTPVEVTLVGTEPLAGYAATAPLHLEGQHNAENLAAAVLATALQPDGSWAPIAEDTLRIAMAGLQVPGGRLRERVLGGRVVLDDAYNANPSSMVASLGILARRPGTRVAVLGDMLELGADEAALHRMVGESAAESADVVVAIGPRARDIAAGAGENAHWFEHPAEAAAWVAESIAAPATVLVKASRGMALERVVAELARVWGEG